MKKIVWSFSVSLEWEIKHFWNFGVLGEWKQQDEAVRKHSVQRTPERSPIYWDPNSLRFTESVEGEERNWRGGLELDREDLKHQADTTTLHTKIWQPEQNGPISKNLPQLAQYYIDNSNGPKKIAFIVLKNFRKEISSPRWFH